MKLHTKPKTFLATWYLVASLVDIPVKVSPTRYEVFCVLKASEQKALAAKKALEELLLEEEEQKAQAAASSGSQQKAKSKKQQQPRHEPQLGQKGSSEEADRIKSEAKKAKKQRQKAKQQSASHLQQTAHQQPPAQQPMSHLPSAQETLDKAACAQQQSTLAPAPTTVASSGLHEPNASPSDSAEASASMVNDEQLLRSTQHSKNIDNGPADSIISKSTIADATIGQHISTSMAPGIPPAATEGGLDLLQAASDRQMHKGKQQSPLLPVVKDAARCEDVVGSKGQASPLEVLSVSPEADRELPNQDAADLKMHSSRHLFPSTEDVAQATASTDVVDSGSDRNLSEPLGSVMTPYKAPQESVQLLFTCPLTKVSNPVSSPHMHTRT